MSAKKSQTTKAKTKQTKQPAPEQRGHRVIDDKIAAERALGSSRRPPAVR